jgi:hypothetical protein
MINLQKYVDDKNRWRKLFDRPQLSLTSAQDRQTIADHLDCDLSPENLTCAGERPGSCLQARSQFFNRALRELRILDPKAKTYA